jgi:hypothetical protein
VVSGDDHNALSIGQEVGVLFQERREGVEPVATRAVAEIAADDDGRRGPTLSMYSRSEVSVRRKTRCVVSTSSWTMLTLRSSSVCPGETPPRCGSDM